MIMLKQIAERNGKDLIAYSYKLDKNVYFKIMNTAYRGIRKLHTDQQGICLADSGITAGDVLSMSGYSPLIISSLTEEFFRSEHIRNTIDLIETNNTVNIARPSSTLSSTGALIEKAEPTVVATAEPVKIGTIATANNKDLDISTGTFGMLISSRFGLQMGDSLTFGSHYEPAKIEGIKFNFEGIYEVSFDKDPRWT